MTARTYQVGILCEGTFKPDAWMSNELPRISGLSHKIARSFTPTRVGITEIVTATFASSAFGTERTEVITEEVENCGDLILLERSELGDDGIPAQTLAAGTGRRHKVRWPIAGRGCNLSAAFAVEKTILRRIAPPSGFLFDELVSVHVRARLALFGPVDDSYPPGLNAFAGQKEGPQ